MTALIMILAISLGLIVICIAISYVLVRVCWPSLFDGNLRGNGRLQPMSNGIVPRAGQFG